MGQASKKARKPEIQSLRQGINNLQGMYEVVVLQKNAINQQLQEAQVLIGALVLEHGGEVVLTDAMIDAAGELAGIDVDRVDGDLKLAVVWPPEEEPDDDEE